MARSLSVVTLILYLVTLFASSFVEEEHQFWYFFSMTWWAVLALISTRYLPSGSVSGQLSSFVGAGYCILQMVILRLLRAWNQTGKLHILPDRNGKSIVVKMRRCNNILYLVTIRPEVCGPNRPSTLSELNMDHLFLDNFCDNYHWARRFHHSPCLFTTSCPLSARYSGLEVCIDFSTPLSYNCYHCLDATLDHSVQNGSGIGSFRQ
jgi:hypothetical protein